MGWFKVDDHYFTNPKVWEAGEDAALLNLQGIAYCSANQTDGRIPHGIAQRLTEKENVSELIARLLDAGLWKKTSKNYIIHDYLDHQSSRAQIRAKREKGAKRSADFRARNGVTNGSRNAEVTGSVTTPDVDAEADKDGDTESEAYRISPGFKDSSLTAISLQASEHQADEVDPAVVRELFGGIGRQVA